MCIIVYKPAGIALPATLADCWNNNDDGAGYCYLDENNRVNIKKGFMSYAGLCDSLACLDDIESKDLLIHFRIATHGGVNKEFCHPFPVSNKMQDLTATRIKTKCAVLHNGIISGFGSKTVSDTADYIQNVVYPLFNAVKYKQSKYTDSVLESTISYSRLAIMDLHGVRLIGSWEECNGCYYSNGNYKPYVATTKYYGSACGYSDYDYDYDYYSTSPKDDDYWYTEKLYRIPLGEFVDFGGYILQVNATHNLYIDEVGDIYEYQKGIGRYMLTDYRLLDEYCSAIPCSEIVTALQAYTCIGNVVVYY